MENKNWEYETKCRRCGEIQSWELNGIFIWIEFANAMTDYIQCPRCRPCEKCKKETVQDVVSYAQP